MSNGFATVSHADGESLFEPGDQALRFYVVQTGQVAIIDRKSNKTLAVLKPGESFGEQALLEIGRAHV